MKDLLCHAYSWHHIMSCNQKYNIISQLISESHKAPSMSCCCSCGAGRRVQDDRHLQVALALFRVDLQVVEVATCDDPPLLQPLGGQLVILHGCDVANIATPRVQHDPHSSSLVIHHLAHSIASSV